MTEQIKSTGKIVRIIGPVIDVVFEGDHLPAIYNALEVMRLNEKGKEEE